MPGDLKLSASGWIVAGLLTIASILLMGLLARACRK